jgi:hypothetical protein
MLQIGQHNKLTINRLVDFGAYLDAGNGEEILLPARYMTGSEVPGSEVEVFVYTDSEDRLVATTEQPLIQVGQFAFLQTLDIHPKMGAFLNWGLAKDLLCPFNEQRQRMVKGQTYLVYAYLDDATKRVVASSKIEKFLGNKIPYYKFRDRVNALVYDRTDIGFRVIVDNLFAGMLYSDELLELPKIGDTITAYVKKVREDGKIDVTLKESNAVRAHSLADKIVALMHDCGGTTTLNDKSSPEEIAQKLGCSKKDFKKAVGFLYKSHKIGLFPGGMKLL